MTQVEKGSFKGVLHEFDVILDNGISLKDFKVKIDWLFKRYFEVKPSIDEWIRRAWDQFSENAQVQYEDRNVEVNLEDTSNDPNELSLTQMLYDPIVCARMEKDALTVIAKQSSTPPVPSIQY
ncbi:hypothetical protein L1887_05606 [Cichorium endivia]|nr:hypothetical protein L1887_05606 [Cichorium endivia]